MFWWITATVCAFFIKGLCGFANTLVFTTILSFGNDNANISPVELVLGYPTNLIVAWRERKSIRWSVCLPLAALVAGQLKPTQTHRGPRGRNRRGVRHAFGRVLSTRVVMEVSPKDHRPKRAISLGSWPDRAEPVIIRAKM